MEGRLTRPVPEFRIGVHDAQMLLELCHDVTDNLAVDGPAPLEDFSNARQCQLVLHPISLSCITED